MPAKRKASDSMFVLFVLFVHRNDKTNLAGGRSSRASKRPTPIPDSVGSSDDYSDWEEDVKDDNIKSTSPTGVEEPADSWRCGFQVLTRVV